MKHKIINILVLVITLSLVLFFTLKDDFSGVITELKSINVTMIIISLIILLISMFIKSLSLNAFLNKKYKKSIGYTYKLTLIGNFVSGITPFNSGGQPYEIYLLKKDGIRISDSTSAMIKDFMSYQISIILIAITMLILNKEYGMFPTNSNVNILIWCGFILNMIILLLLLMVSFSKKIVTKILKLVSKIKFIGNKIKNTDKIEESLSNFYSSATEIKKDKWIFLKCILLNIIHLITLYTIPLFVFRSFGITNISLVKSVSATTFVMLIGNSVPIPGGSGGIEYSFMQLFGIFVKGSTLSGAMLIWRFVTYAFSLIIGFLILIIKKGSDKK